MREISTMLSEYQRRIADLFERNSVDSIEKHALAASVLSKFLENKYDKLYEEWIHYKKNILTEDKTYAEVFHEMKIFLGKHDADTPEVVEYFKVKTDTYRA